MWKRKVASLMRCCIDIHSGSKRLPYMKELFDYMMSDLWWMKDMVSFVKLTKAKIIEYKKSTTISEYYKEYFRNVEETFGFATYCCSNTGNYRCENSIKGKQNYCEMHKKLLKIKSDRISPIIGSSDVSMLIAQYM
jgi:hypothetical protein